MPRTDDHAAQHLLAFNEALGRHARRAGVDEKADVEEAEPMMTQAQLRLLAARRVAQGGQLVRDHVRDGVGCCRRCGREYPCDGQRLGLALAAYYRRFAATGDEPAQVRTIPTTTRPSALTEDQASPSRLYLVRTRERLSRWLVRHAPR